jgi:uncharacterized protein
MPGRFVLYHSNCVDGFGAAWAAWRALGNTATYLPVQYHERVPPEVTDGSDVWILDFSYPRAELIALRARTLSLDVIDHHATSAADLQGLDFARFDMEKSGAVLAWEHFHPGEPVPEVLLYVQDRDLWQWRLPASEAVSAAIDLHPFDFLAWNALTVEELKREGAVALKLQKRLVAEMADRASVREVGGFSVPVVNATCYGSEVGSLLLERYPHAPFAAFWSENEGVRRWGLRSRRGGFDVGELARKLGGGGHRTAAGFRESARASLP